MIRAKNETERMVLKKFEDSYRSWKALPQDCPEYVWNAFYKQYQIIQYTFEDLLGLENGCVCEFDIYDGCFCVYSFNENDEPFLVYQF